jgi:hypothetical protein
VHGYGKYYRITLTAGEPQDIVCIGSSEAVSRTEVQSQAISALSGQHPSASDKDEPRPAFLTNHRAFARAYQRLEHKPCKVTMVIPTLNL